MATGTFLGVIEQAQLELHPDVGLGVFIKLRSEGGNVDTSIDLDFKVTSSIQQQQDVLSSMFELKTMMEKARIRYIEDFRGIPVEVTFESNLLISWRILQECIL